MFSGNKDIVEDLIFHSADIEAEDIKGYGHLFFLPYFLINHKICIFSECCSLVLAY